MEIELIQGLKDVGYLGPLLDPSKISEALQGGPKSTDFTHLVSWLTNEINYFGKFDETVHPTSSPDDAHSFLLELSIFLQELECTNTKLMTKNVNERLSNIEEREVLLDYLIVELMTSKILETKKTEKKNIEITISESTTAKCMREMLSALEFTKPPENITPETLFKKLHTKVTELLKKVPKELVGKPLFFGELNNDQWENLNKLQGDLNEEYTIRRVMLLQRLDVTINSFLWSDRLKQKSNEINNIFTRKRENMKREPNVTLAHLLSSRDDLALIEKLSSTSVRKNTRCAINSFIIGSVPDRGGRPYEQEPPPPEVPSWKKDKVQGPQGYSSGGRDGGRGGHQRGGRGRGGGYRDNKSATSNFGQNFDAPQTSGFGQQNFSFGTQARGYTHKNPNLGYQNTGQQNYGNQSGYSYQNSGYGGSQGGYSGQNYAYGNQGSRGYNQNSSSANQGGYDNKSGGDYNKSGRNRSRVQGGWNQDSDGSYSNNYRGGNNYNNQGHGGRRY